MKKSFTDRFGSAGFLATFAVVWGIVLSSAMNDAVGSRDNPSPVSPVGNYADTSRGIDTELSSGSSVLLDTPILFTSDNFPKRQAGGEDCPEVPASSVGLGGVGLSATGAVVLFGLFLGIFVPAYKLTMGGELPDVVKGRLFAGLAISLMGFAVFMAYHAVGGFG